LAVAAVVQLRRERALAAMRQDFVTRTSHELRTPVARIRIFTDTLLLDRVRTDNERREAVQAIDRAARRLSWLVENVLQLSRTDAGEAGYHVEPTDLASFVRDIVEELETTVSGARVTVMDTSAQAHAKIDRDAMRQALLNLLDNAWKYGGTDAPIRVSVSAAEGEVRIRVADSGPGVPEKDRARIWEPYVRLDRDRRSSVAGTGIGLAVVRDIVLGHRGRVWVESGESGGAAFVIALPAADPVSEPMKSLA
jgi:signal transduction histidine kinase